VSGVEGMGTDDFWSDDAAASQRRASDLRMPPAAIVVPADLMGSNAKPSADYRAMPRKKNFMRLIIGGMIVGVFTVVALNFQYGQAVTLVEFNALRTGMTVEQCNEIVGARPSRSQRQSCHQPSSCLSTSAQSSGSTTTTALRWPGSSMASYTANHRRDCNDRNHKTLRCHARVGETSGRQPEAVHFSGRAENGRVSAARHRPVSRRISDVGK